MDDWRPNWRDPTQYPTELLLQQWRWQFLRRREDYQSDWRLYHPESYQYWMRSFLGKPCPEGITSWEEHFASFADMPESRDKYGVNFLLDPACPEPGMNLFTTTEGFIVTKTSEKEMEEFQKQGLLLYAFNRHKPIKPQLDAARINLEAFQETSPAQTRRHKEKWPTYLRLLDGRAAGETFETLGKTLLMDDPDSPESHGGSAAAAKAHQTWSAARQLMFNWIA